MRGWLVALMIALAGCGPEPGQGAAESTSSGSTTATGTTGADPTTEGSTTNVDTTSAETSGAQGSTDGSSTGVMETCTPGTFEGFYTVELEGSAFHDCATGEWAAFAPGRGNVGCPAEMWIRVDGELCGPGNYGHLGGSEYELRGEIVLGPCEAACGEDPPDDACTSFDALCPFYGCDPVAQDCRVGNRCAPTSADGAPPWTGTACVPLDDDAQPIGAPCDPGAQWGGDCEAAAFCVDDGTGQGVCAPLCNYRLDECEVGTCWPCAFAEPDELGICSDTEVAC